MRLVRAGIAILLFVLVATPVLAHVPAFPGDTSTPDRALVVDDAAKSWSFYDRLAPGEVSYYRLRIDDGERLHVGTYTPAAGRFTPSIVLMSPSVNRTDSVPAGVTVPDGMGATVIEGRRPSTATYEPFAPSAIFHTADVTRDPPGERTYLVAIYEPANLSGPAGVTVGDEEAFSPIEYVTVPFDLIRVHLWEGQHPLIVGGPLLLTIIGGIAALARRNLTDRRTAWARSLVGIGGVLLLSSGLNTGVQLGIALTRTGPTLGALLTLVFVLVPVLCGGWALLLADRSEWRHSRRRRLGLAVAGVAALLTWAGFIVGPALLLFVAATPRSLHRES